jgi:putative membrane protein
VPLVLLTLTRAWKAQWARHRRLARWTLPLWLYVSMTGVVIYLMLYQLYPVS